ncbi:MAG: hypothetical protein JXR52_11030 [Bacteroidales bacterium]|nr:hypothetical protein [Bacteroidales bacterium]
MKKDLRNIFVNSVSLLLIGVLFVIIANKAVFTHTHLLGNGEIITHAHPFDRKTDSQPSDNHHHSESELLFFQICETLYPVMFISAGLIGLLPRLKSVIHFSRHIHYTFIPFHTGRLPPAA